MIGNTVKEDVYSSPLFLKKSLAASLKGVFSGFNLLPESRKSSPTKLQAQQSSGKHHILVNEEEEERKSYDMRDLEA